MCWRRCEQQGPAHHRRERKRGGPSEGHSSGFLRNSSDLTLRFRKRVPCCLPRGAERPRPHKTCSSSHNSQSLGTTGMPFVVRGMDWLIQITEHCAELQGNEPSSPEKTWRSLTFTSLRERSRSEKAPCSVILPLTFLIK